MTPPASVRAALQARCHRTLDALVDIAEALLRERPFEDISVAEI